MSDDADELTTDDRLFVQIALKNELVTEQQISEARAIQARIAELGVSVTRLGDIFVEKGFLTQDQYDKIKVHADRLRKADMIRGYRLMSKLGKGSMGTVYKARQLSLDRVVAVKILAPFLQNNEKYVTRFIKEAKILARLNHPNIVQCIDVGVSSGKYYFAMEFCDGPTVLELIRRGGKMAEERAVRIVLQVARALDHAYQSEVIHRDIKPDNIMIIEGGTAKLCDLGLVKDMSTSGDTTDQGTTLGTPNYIAPEQARGDEHVDCRADIYSLGASLYHMVTGHTPFENDNPAVTMVAHINDVPPTPAERNPDLLGETSRVISKMMRKNADDRYQTPADLVRDLQKLHAKLSGEPAPTGPGAAPRPRTRRRRR